MSDNKLKTVRRDVFGGFTKGCRIEKIVSPVGTESLYPKIIIPDDPHALKPVEPVLGDFMFEPTIERRADGSFRIVEVSLIGRRKV